MSFFGFGFRSGVYLDHASETVQVPLKDGETESLSSLVTRTNPGLDTTKNFWLNPFLPNAHFQTVYSSIGYHDNLDKVYYARRDVRMADGGTVSIDHVVHPSEGSTNQSEGLAPRTRYMTKQEEEAEEYKDDSTPLLISLHGLTGGSHESYLRATVARLTSSDYGFEALVINSRACARTPLTSPQLFNAEWTSDMRATVKDLRKRYPNRPFFAVGYSLGASILTNYLGEEGGGCDLTAAVVVGNPWDLMISSVYMENTWVGKHTYSPAFCKALIKMVKRHDNILRDSKIYAQTDFSKLKTTKDFDNALTAPMFGYHCAEEYYRHASSVNKIFQIKTPTLGLNALDDPISPSWCFPYDEIKFNPYMILATTDLGGHLGWFLPNGERWFPNVIGDFFSTFVKETDLKKRCVAKGAKVL